VKAGRFKIGEGSLGKLTTPAIDHVTANQPSAASTLGLDTPSSQTTPAKEEHLKLPESKFVKSPSGVTLAYASPPNNHLLSTKRKPVKSPSGVTLAYLSGANTPTNGHVNLSDGGPRKSSPLRGLADAVEVIGSVRGIGWDWGKGLYIAPETRPLDRSAFIKATIQTFVLSFLALDVIEASLKLIPPFRTPRGGSIFFMTAPPAFLTDHALLSPIIEAHPALSAFITKYTVSTAISFFIGLAIIAGFEMCYAMLTLFCVGLLGHNTESWPPIFDHPWRATSLADFWGRRWHQTLRQTFFIFGGFPLQWIINQLLRPIIGQAKAASYGRVGLVLGTFIASGLFHGLSIYGMGEGGVDHVATLYFSSQGLLLLAERVWRKFTGKRVGGTLGTIWTYAAVIFGIEFCSEWFTMSAFSDLC
jgi:Membrane bound O-acyl transferase family